MGDFQSKRIETLDWLRGLMAISIMLYHLTNWLISPLDSSNILGRFGIYGVSIFFVLSGLSMAIVYNRYIYSIQTSLNFYIRRVFRIWPLLWIASFLTIIPQIVNTRTLDWQLLLLNITTLFGFLKPSAYIVPGAWSIGNEMVYYALTPFLFIIYNYRRLLGNILLIFTLFIGLYFSFKLLNSNIILAKQWSIYINPFNNFFFYVMGVAIYYNFNKLKINSTLNVLMLIMAISLFCFLPFKGDQISIVTGFNRIIFILLCFIIVLCFYKLKNQLPVSISEYLETLGIATYGIYIIHPIIYSYASYFLKGTELNLGFLLFSIVVVLTIVISIISYKIFELKLIKVGKELTLRLGK